MRRDGRYATVVVAFAARQIVGKDVGIRRRTLDCSKRVPSQHVLPVHPAALVQDDILDGPVRVGENLLDREKVIGSPSRARSECQHRPEDRMY